jgi:hypothetical protein
MAKAKPRPTPPPPPPTSAGPAAEELAKLVVRTLDRQKEYFRTKNPAALDESKRLEGLLRTAAAAEGAALGALALRTMDRQREFFRSGNDRQQLLECKQLERRLRDAAHQVLHPAQDQPTLFGD